MKTCAHKLALLMHHGELVVFCKRCNRNESEIKESK